MSEGKPTSAKADALARQLKDSLTKRRPQPWRAILLALCLCTLVLALLAYWLYPRPQPAPLQILALDIVCAAGETPRVRAQLFVPPDEEAPRTIQGHTIVFHEQRLFLKPNDKPQEVLTTTDEHGQASAEWRTPRLGVVDFLANYIDVAQQVNQPANGRLFTWPKDSHLLIVDADALLAEHGVAANASETLTRAAKEGWHVVYLALAKGQVNEFRKTRAWLSVHQSKLPIGPLLGKPHFISEESPDLARRAAIRSLQERFAGQIVAIVKTMESAEIGKEMGLRTILIGAGPAPERVMLVPSWADVVVRLK